MVPWYPVHVHYAPRNLTSFHSSLTLGRGWSVSARGAESAGAISASRHDFPETVFNQEAWVSVASHPNSSQFRCTIRQGQCTNERSTSVSRKRLLGFQHQAREQTWSRTCALLVNMIAVVPSLVVMSLITYLFVTSGTSTGQGR